MISEAYIDLAFLIIKDKKLENASDDIGAFEVLKENKIISPALWKAARFKKDEEHTYSFIWTNKWWQSFSCNFRRIGRRYI